MNALLALVRTDLKLYFSNRRALLITLAILALSILARVVVSAMEGRRD